MQHFGLEIIANVLRLDEDHPHVHQLYPAIYRNFVEVTNFSMSCVMLLIKFSRLLINITRCHN